MRIGGLASGIDTDSIIKDLMKAERQPLIRLQQERQLTEWKRDSYREINTKILEFQQNTIANLRMDRTLLAKQASVTGNTETISARALTNSGFGSMSVKVTRMATAASNNSSAVITNGTEFDPSKTLASQASFLAGNLSSDSYSFKINGTEITVDPNTESLNDVLRKINNNTNVNAIYINGADGGRVSLAAKETGLVNGGSDPSIISLEDDNNFLAGILNISGTGTKAQNAIVEINGMSIEQTSNTFQVNGVEITLHQETPAGGAASTITVETNVDSIVDSIKNFIDQYNELLILVQDATGEPRYRDFPPLTDEQKEEMTEREIELWEEKAKSGLLRNDSMLNEMISNLRASITSNIDTGNELFNTLHSIGIETGHYRERGKLIFNEEKLREAIAADPEAVAAMFNKRGEGSEAGILEQMRKSLDNSLSKLTSYAGGRVSYGTDNSSLTKELSRIDSRIEDWNDRLLMIEDRYFRQFAAMEQAINRYNLQASYLANAFGYGM